MREENLKAKTGKTDIPHLEADDQFIASKIGSAYMSTIEGQPHEDEDRVEREVESGKTEEYINKFRKGTRFC